MGNLPRGIGAFALLATFSLSISAQEAGTGIEEVIVTAQRTAESIQDVPIAVTAMTGDMLEEKQVITVSDLQMNAPNVSFTPTNFGSNSFSIRGIGRLVTASTGDAGVSIHVNEVAMPVNLTAVEFYDMERVEVLRGPQGTLYGRNATGGAINLVTRLPDFESVGGFVDFEAGDYESYRLKGALNIPITDTFAIRFAGMKLDRDGYTKNLAHGQVGVDGSTIDGISKRVDGRDILTTRLTANWDITERDNLWVMWSYFDENDNRARITNQVCVQNELPTYGCKPDEVGFEQPHLTSRFDMLTVGLYGVVPFGAPNATNVYNWPRPEIDSLREMHTDFEPVYKDRENAFLFGYTHEFDSMTLGVTGGYRRSDANYRQDYNMNVGVEFGPLVGVTAPNPFRADGDYPVSETAGGDSLKAAGDDFLSGPCNAFDGTSGIWGGCQITGFSRDFTFDQASGWSDYYTVEAKLQTSFEGPVNFLVGASYFDFEAMGDYYVNANGLDARADYYTGFFNNTGDPDGDTFGEGWAVFGEVYWDITDRVKLTAGLRYNDDDKSVRDTSLLWNAEDANFPGSLPLDDNTVPPLWTRVIGIVNGDAGDPVDAGERAMAKYYGVSDADIDAAALTPAQSAQRLAINSAVPIVPDFNETRDLTGSPSEFNWKETTGRLGIDWQATDNALIYGFYSRGYKPGGANPAIPTQFQADSAFDFEPEFIDSFEIGFKTSLADNTMILNGAAFMYDYKGLQVARIKNNTSLNENIDADVWGAEFEWVWQPEQLPGLAIDAHYSYLNTEAKGESVDPTNREGGDPDFVTLNDFAFLYAARRDQLTPELVQTAIDLTGLDTRAPGAVYIDEPGVPDGTPVVLSRTVLGLLGVDTVEGIPVDLDGNSLPNAPENTIHLGAAYTWGLGSSGDLTLRWDYYWQDDSYAREFNTIGDQIDSWDQHNLSLFYNSADGRWQGKLWVRNIEDEENVTGHYLTSDTSGYYRNYFLTEPRVWGASVRYTFGGG
jgi:outer membrane receptor protein involved in Fe transport